ncbi:hypothetical protein C3486_17625 [Streptomyces sp. Ru73]|uniref:hypothetical protein n=1 Tax=Streptomyces sp. Ru73 TaxID=2080748 RepID=UPI000CDDFF23|nr:hypothetical protein [Streptomyces sp. Ru73]POX39590.1 hypothetical protein C3486_17625 [Streptomyces sp. Ru73]
MRYLRWGPAARDARAGWEEDTYRKALEAVGRHDAAVARWYLERLLRTADTAPETCSGTAARALYLLAGLDAAEGLLFSARSRYAESAMALEGARSRAERAGDGGPAAMLAEFRDLARAVAADLAENCGLDGGWPEPGHRAVPPGEPAGTAG